MIQQARKRLKGVLVGFWWIITVFTCKPDCASPKAASCTDNLSSFISGDIVLFVEDVCSFNNILRKRKE